MFVGSGTGSAILKALAIVAIGSVIIFFVGVIVYIFLQKKKYYITIELYKKMGGQTVKHAIYKACDHKIGKAGDKLWNVAKVKKFISPGVHQIAPNVYMYFEREDGEWINIWIGDIDKEMKKAGVKYLHQDMRAQRIAIAKMLEAELKNTKSFWDKYGATLTLVLEMLVFAIAVVLILYQAGEVVGKMDQVVGNMNKVVVNINSLADNVTMMAKSIGVKFGSAPKYIEPLKT